MPEPIVEPMRLDCSMARDRASAAVVCRWQARAVDGVDEWVLMRTRNGEPRQVVAVVRPGVGDAIDPDVVPGDTVIYVVQGRRFDRIVGASEPVAITVD